MDLQFSRSDEEFRAEVRGFLEANLPPSTRAAVVEGRHLDRQAMQEWTRILHRQGWSAPGWPHAYGGPGWSPLQRYIFSEELYRAYAPSPFPPGVNMVGPVIYTFGDAEQKARFLPGILTLDTWWCQGFSEPGAGSDLASLKTTARLDGDDYVVNGQKTWTTYAQHADWIFLLARTDPSAKKQDGISFLLADMNTPGITVRPILNIEGAHEVNEVFLDEVRVPRANLIGGENNGWACAKFLLGNERMNMARVGLTKQRLRRIRAIASEEVAGGAPIIEDPRFRERIVALEVELKALEITQLRVLTAAPAREGDGDPAVSILKLRGSELQQKATELMLDLAGPYAAPFAEGEDGPLDWPQVAASTYFNARKVSIYGGASEIQRTIIAKSVLGL